MSSSDSDQSDLLAALTEEITDRLRRGEAPSIEEYARSHPHVADRLRRIFRGLLELRACAPTGGPDLATAQPDAPRTIAAYRLLREIGRGGMGVVYEAEQPALGRRVALKVLSHHLSDPASLARFRREAAVAAGLHHGNVVPVFEAGQDGEVCYFAMQYVPGHSLAQLIAQAPKPSAAAADTLAQETLSPEEAAAAQERTPVVLTLRTGGPPMPDHRGRAAMALQAARGLAFAHSRGVVHRDVKPSNLLLDPDGVVWVSDFGLVKTEDSDLTQSGAVVGTLRYLAPEALRGRSDRRSDVYSLGLTLYELLTLRPAFSAATPQQMLETIRTAQPRRPRALDPTIPLDLERIVLKAADRDPARRYQTADEMAEDLRRFLAGEPVAARPPGALERLAMWARREPVVASLAAAVVAALALGLLFSSLFAWRAEGQAVLAREKQAEADDNARAATQSAEAAKAALQKEALANEARGKALRRADGLRLVALSEGERDRDPALALLLALEGACRAPGPNANAALQEALEECNEQRTLAGHQKALTAASFSDDGKKVVTCSDDGTARIWDAGPGYGPGRQLLEVKAKGVQLARLSPDGKRLVTLSGPGTLRGTFAALIGMKAADWERLGPVARLWDAATGEAVAQWRPKGPNGDATFYHAAGAAFSPDGRRVVTFFGTEPTGVPTVHDARTGERLATLDGPLPVFAAAYAPAGDVIATANGDDRIHLWDSAGNELHVLEGHRCNVAGLAFSSDGKQLLTWGNGKRYVAKEGRASFQDAPDDAAARVWDVAGGKLVKALEWPEGDRKPPLAGRFFPDPRVVALAFPFSRRRTWLVAEGKPHKEFGHPELGFATNPVAVGVAISPDCQSVAYVGDRRGARLIAWGQPVEFRGHEGRVETVAFSPDGSRVLTSSIDGTARIWTAPALGVGNPPPTGLWYFSEASPSPDGSRLFLRSPFAPGAELIDGRSGRQVARLKEFFWGAQMTPDGRKLIGLVSAAYNARQPRRLLSLDLGSGAASLSAAEVEGKLVAVSPDGSRALLDLNDSLRPDRRKDAVAVVDVASGKVIATAPSPPGQAPEAAFSPDGGLALVGWARQGGVPEERLMLDAATGKEVWRLGGKGRNLVWAGFAQGGRTVLALFAEDAAIFRAYDARTGKQTLTCTDRTLRPPEVRSPAFSAERLRLLSLSPDGGRVLFGPYLSQVGVWDLSRRGEPAANLRGHAVDVTCCAFSADGNRILTAGTDRTSRVWDAAGRQVAIFRGHDSTVVAAALDPAGERVATAELDGTVRVWEVRSGQETHRLRWRGQQIRRVAFTADGGRVCLGALQHTRLWDLDVAKVARSRLPRGLTPAERARYEAPEGE
jgi:WD40 repeat protein/serine/threonine protein kinase